MITPENQRQILDLDQTTAMTVREIAEAVGVPQTTVYDSGLGFIDIATSFSCLIVMLVCGVNQPFDCLYESPRRDNRNIKTVAFAKFRGPRTEIRRASARNPLPSLWQAFGGDFG